MSLKPSKEELRWLHERPYRESPKLRAVEALEEKRLAARIAQACNGTEPLAGIELRALIGALRARNLGALTAERTSGAAGRRWPGKGRFSSKRVKA